MGTIISLIEREDRGMSVSCLLHSSVCVCLLPLCAQPRGLCRRDYGDPSVRKVPRSRNEKIHPVAVIIAPGE